MGVCARRKGVFVILDGLGDRPAPALDMATPLEAASTPVMDGLAAAGICGLVDPLAPGIPVGTHTGAGALMGIPFRDLLRLDRGPVEAAGIGMDLNPGDVALRCNFATLEDDGAVVRDRRAGRIMEGTMELAGVLRDVALSNGIKGSLFPATQHRAVLCLSGAGLSASITDTDPGDCGIGARVLRSEPKKPDSAGAIRTAQALNEFIQTARDRLPGHPVNADRLASGLLQANGVICRGAGKVHRVGNVLRYLGVRAAVVGAERTILGLGRMLDFTIVTDARFTALVNTDLDGKVAAVREAVREHDLVYLHIKAADVCAHDREPIGKKDFIERIDAALAPLLVDNLVIGVTADHSTDSSSGSHCGDPVPALLYEAGGRMDGCRVFGEAACINGGLGRITASEFFRIFLDSMGCVQQYQSADRYLLEE